MFHSFGINATCVCLCVCARTRMSVQRPEVSDPGEGEVTGGCELLYGGGGNQTQVLWKSSTFS